MFAVHRNTLKNLAITNPKARIYPQAPMNPPPPVAEVLYIIANIEREAYKMAGKSKRPNERWNATEFINRNLIETEVKHFKEWYTKENERIGDFLGQILVDDYKLSLTWDDSNQCFIATLTGKEDQKQNAFKAMSSRSDEWYEALALCVFKHLILMRNGKWEGETQKNNWG